MKPERLAELVAREFKLGLRATGKNEAARRRSLNMILRRAEALGEAVRVEMQQTIDDLTAQINLMRRDLANDIGKLRGFADTAKRQAQDAELAATASSRCLENHEQLVLTQQARRRGGVR